MTKKLLSVALVIVMMFSLAIPALAASKDTAEDIAMTAAKVSFLANEASSEQIETAKIVTSYEKDGDWHIKVRCDGGFYYACTVEDGVLGLIPSDVDAGQESTFVAFFKTIIETVMNVFYGIIY